MIDAEVVAVMIGRLRVVALDVEALELLAPIAQGRTDASIAAELMLTQAEVAGRAASAFALLGLPFSPHAHERVTALVRRATQRAPLR